MILMVSLLIFRPRFRRVRAFASHRDGRKMGFQPLRDNQGLRHRIFAPIAGNTVTPVKDAPVASLGVAHALTGSFALTAFFYPRTGWSRYFPIGGNSHGPRLDCV